MVALKILAITIISSKDARGINLPEGIEVKLRTVNNDILSSLHDNADRRFWNLLRPQIE